MVFASGFFVFDYGWTTPPDHPLSLSTISLARFVSMSVLRSVVLKSLIHFQFLGRLSRWVPAGENNCSTLCHDTCNIHGSETRAYFHGWSSDLHANLVGSISTLRFTGSCWAGVFGTTLCPAICFVD